MKYKNLGCAVVMAFLASQASAQSPAADCTLPSAPALNVANYGRALSPLDLALPTGKTFLIGANTGVGDDYVDVMTAGSVGAGCNLTLQARLLGTDFLSTDPGFVTDTLFGFSVDRIGDIHVGDPASQGEEEFIVGAPGDVNTGPLTSHGQLVVFDGSTLDDAYPGGQFLGGQFGPSSLGARLGYSVSGFGPAGAVTDVGGSQPNGLPVPDYLAGAPEGTLTSTSMCDGVGYVLVYDGGPPADALGNPNPTGGSILYQVDGNDLYFAGLASCPPLRFGHAVDGLGDLDGDGFADFAVGAPNSAGGACGGPSSCFDLPLEGDVFEVGAVYVFSGATPTIPGTPPTLLAELRGPMVASPSGQVAPSHFGYDVSLAGDVDQDGLPDLLIGAPDAIDPRTPEAGRVGAAHVYSGADILASGSAAVPILSFYGDQPDESFGIKVACMGDVDQDGSDDLGVRSLGRPSQGIRSYGRVLSGSDGHVVFQVSDVEPNNEAEHCDLAAIGDVDGDGTTEMLMGNNHAISIAPHEVLLHSIQPSTDGLQGFPELLPQPGRHQFFVNGGAAQAGNSYLIVGSISGSAPGFPIGGFHLPLNYDTYFVQSLTGANTGFWVNTFAPLNSQGRGQGMLRIQAPLTWPGGGNFPIHHAVIFLDSANVVTGTSNAVKVELLP